MKKIVILSFVIIAMLGFLIGLALQIPSKISKNKAEKRVWTSEDQLKYANMLLAKGLYNEAAKAFEKYIKENKFKNKKDLSKICYRIGDIYMDLHKYEKALKFFYKAEMLDNKAPFKDEMNQKIVESLEKLGMSSQAQYELQKRTSLNPVKEKEGKVVAKIGEGKITMQEVNKALDKLPDWMKKKYKGKNMKEFVREYVTNEALYNKGERLGIDKRQKIREEIENFRKSTIINTLLQDEIKEKLHVSNNDLMLYYKANKEKYIEPAKIKLSFLEIKNKMDKESAINYLKQGKGKKIDNWIEKGDESIPGIGKAKDIIDKLLLEKKGDISSFKIGSKSYVFLINDKKEKREKSFDEVKNEVLYEYKMEKQKEIINSFIKKVLEEEKVEIY